MNIFSINNNFTQFTGLKRLGVFLLILIAFFVLQTIGAYCMATFFNPENFRDVIGFENPFENNEYVYKPTFFLIYIALFFHLFIGFYFFYLLLKVIYLSKPMKVEILKLVYSFVLTILYIMMLYGSFWNDLFEFSIFQYLYFLSI